MRRTSPPKHRHDGTSPLPLGMDWSPPPKKWFYRVQVGLQSPDGITTVRAVLRRFNDFLKLYSDLKKSFPKKSLPFAPPKGLLRMRSRALLEQRRCSLEEWMAKLLSDIDISRSVMVASFLELEAAARASCLEASQQSSGANPSSSTVSANEFHASLSLPTLAGNPSIRSDYGSDTVYETSELGTPSLDRDDSSDPGLEDLTMYEDLTSPTENLVSYSMSNIDEGLLMGESILDQLEGDRKSKSLIKQITDNGNVQKDASLAFERLDSLFDAEPSREVVHVRRSSNESIESDMSSNRVSELLNSWTPHMLSEATFDPVSAEGSRAMEGHGGSELQFHNREQILVPVDQQSKLNKILLFMQRRLVTARTDMEDMISRLNQEIAVKEYLTTRVKDLEVELETTKQKSKENLQHALLIEKERVTKMQWDMEELRRKSLEMELRLKSQEDKLQAGPASTSSSEDKFELLQQLDTAREQINTLLKQHGETEAKSKSDIKILVKEVKFLRTSQNELKQQLQQSLLEKSEAEQLLRQEKQRNEEALTSRTKLLQECEILQIQLQEYSIKFTEQIISVADSSLMDNVLDLLTKSDDQIAHLLAEVRSIAEENNLPSDDDDEIHNRLKRMDNELRKILREIIADNAELRKQVNYLIRSAMKINMAAYQEKGEESPSVGSMLKKTVETWK